MLSGMKSCTPPPPTTPFHFLFYFFQCSYELLMGCESSREPPRDLWTNGESSTCVLKELLFVVISIKSLQSRGSTLFL